MRARLGRRLAQPCPWQPCPEITSCPEGQALQCIPLAPGCSCCDECRDTGLGAPFNSTGSVESTPTILGLSAPGPSQKGSTASPPPPSPTALGSAASGSSERGTPLLLGEPSQGSHSGLPTALGLAISESSHSGTIVAAPLSALGGGVSSSSLAG